MYHPAMSNVFRLRSTDRIFFVTACLHHSLKPLSETEFPFVLRAFEAARKRLGFLVCAYVLMPDHWHALLSVSLPLTISQSVQQIKYMSARSINRHRKRSGALWLHQFWDRFVRSKKEFQARLEYMQLNPVLKGLVSRPEDWPWSSFPGSDSHPLGADKSIVHVDLVQLPDGYRA